MSSHIWHTWIMLDLLSFLRLIFIPQLYRRQSHWCYTTFLAKTNPFRRFICRIYIHAFNPWRHTYIKLTENKKSRFPLVSFGQLYCVRSFCYQPIVRLSRVDKAKGRNSAGEPCHDISEAIVSQFISEQPRCRNVFVSPLPDNWPSGDLSVAITLKWSVTLHRSALKWWSLYLTSLLKMCGHAWNPTYNSLW